MKFKFLLLTSIIVLSVIGVNAQNEGISFGLRGGFNMQTFNGKDMNNEQLKMDMVPRFNAGVVINIPVAPTFYFQSGLLFATKGAKSTDQFLGLDMSAEYNLSYIELPLNLMYREVLGNGHVLLGFGPYLAYGVAGKAEFVIGGATVEEKIEFTNEYSSLNPSDWKYFKPFDYGGNVFFGYELQNGLSLQLNAQLGMAKINSDNTTVTTSKTIFKNTGFGVSLAYMF